MFKRKIIIGSQIIGLLLAVLFFAACGKGDIPTIPEATPTFSPAPTPSPTPVIAEDETQNDVVFLGFDALMDYVTSSQYNYIMSSTEDFFNALFQSNIRNYQFSKFKSANSDLLHEKFMFSSDAETKVPFNMFDEVFAGDAAEYRFVLDEESIIVGSGNYKYNVDLYIGSEQKETFLFVVNKKTLQIKINDPDPAQP